MSKNDGLTFRTQRARNTRPISWHPDDARFQSRAFILCSGIGEQASLHRPYRRCTSGTIEIYHVACRCQPRCGARGKWRQIRFRFMSAGPHPCSSGEPDASCPKSNPDVRGPGNVACLNHVSMAAKHEFRKVYGCAKSPINEACKVAFPHLARCTLHIARILFRLIFLQIPVVHFERKCIDCRGIHTPACRAPSIHRIP